MPDNEYDIVGQSHYRVQTKFDHVLKSPITGVVNDNAIFIDQPDVDLSVYRPIYNYSSTKLTAVDNYKNKYSVIYQLAVKIGSKFYILEEVEVSDGEYTLSNLAIGETYYITAIDTSGTYKAQTAVLTPDSLDESLTLFVLEVYNKANDTDFFISFNLKNVIDERHSVTIIDQPSLILTRLDVFNYSISGIPSSSNIILKVDHFTGERDKSEYYTLTVNGTATPILSNNIFVYEPSRYFIRNNNLENAMYVLGPISERLNYQDTLYEVTDESVNKLLDYTYTTSFNISHDIDRLTNSVSIENVVGEIQNNTIAILGNEVIKIVSYYEDSKSIIIERGHEGSRPLYHTAGSICFVQVVGSKLDEFDKMTVQYESSTFSDTTVERSTVIEIVSTDKYRFSILPANIRFDNQYWLTTKLSNNKTLSVSMNYRDDMTTMSWYDNRNSSSATVSNTTVTVTLFDTDYTILDELEYDDSIINLNYANCKDYKIILRIVADDHVNEPISYYKDIIIYINPLTNKSAVNLYPGVFLQWDHDVLENTNIDYFEYK